VISFIYKTTVKNKENYFTDNCDLVITAGSSIIYISLLYKSTNVSPEIS